MTKERLAVLREAASTLRREGTPDVGREELIRYVESLETLLSRISPGALRALDAGKPLPESGWYEISEHGAQTHVYAVWSPEAWKETEELRADVERLRNVLASARSEITRIATDGSAGFSCAVIDDIDATFTATEPKP